MTRIAVALVAFVCAVPLALASLSPKSDSLILGKSLSLVASKTREARAESLGLKGPEEFVITNHTEVTLDGSGCSYKDVPGNASIKHLEIAADRKTILKIDFRTQR